MLAEKLPDHLAGVDVLAGFTNQWDRDAAGPGMPTAFDRVKDHVSVILTALVMDAARVARRGNRLRYQVAAIAAGPPFDPIGYRRQILTGSTCVGYQRIGAAVEGDHRDRARGVAVYLGVG